MIRMATSTNEPNSGPFSHLLHILKENSKSLQSICSKYSSSNTEGIMEFVSRGMEHLQSLSTVIPKLQNNVVPCDLSLAKTCLQHFTQGLLDVTYCEETMLVDGVFAEKTAKPRVQKLLGMLGQPEVICQYCFPEMQPRDILGEELLECLLWRRGALLYMYCHTVQEQEQRRKKEHDDFICNCENGAQYLHNMLQVRKPIPERREDLQCHDDKTYKLIKKGVYSDTHMLALVYGSELCYWYLTYKSETSLQFNFFTPPDVAQQDSNAPKTQAEIEKLEKIQARKKVEARRKNKKPKSDEKTVEDITELKLTPVKAVEPSAVPFDAWVVGSKMITLFTESMEEANGWKVDSPMHLMQYFKGKQPSDTAAVPAPLPLDG